MADKCIYETNQVYSRRDITVSSATTLNIAEGSVITTTGVVNAPAPSAATLDVGILTHDAVIPASVPVSVTIIPLQLASGVILNGSQLPAATINAAATLAQYGIKIDT